MRTAVGAPQYRRCVPGESTGPVHCGRRYSKQRTTRVIRFVPSKFTGALTGTGAIQPALFSPPPLYFFFRTSFSSALLLTYVAVAIVAGSLRELGAAASGHRHGDETAADGGPAGGAHRRTGRDDGFEQPWRRFNSLSMMKRRGFRIPFP